MSPAEVITPSSEPTSVEPTIIRIKGKNTRVPSVDVCGHKVVATGRFLKTAQVFDEELVEGEIVEDPARFAAALKASALEADIFTFAQRPPDLTPRYRERFEWDNWAVAPTENFEAWWGKLPQEARKNVRRSAKKGITVREVSFDDALVRGIQSIYNETPVRQGKAFWHYGKDFATVKMENETYLERSEFIGAFLEDALVGFIKIIYVDRLAVLIQILARNDQQDKRPMNALIAHAMALCERKNLQYLVYGKYVYGKKNDSSLTEFKRRNGFEQIDFPRYYLPLTRRGEVAVRFGFHLGIGSLMPKPVADLLLSSRAAFVKQWAALRLRSSTT